MTHEQKIELAYLIDIMKEASKWRVDEGDDAVRLEVESRIENIMNSTDAEPEQEQESGDGPEPDNPELEEYKAKKRAQNRKAKEKWKKDKVRVFMDGKPVWKPREECHQELRFPDQPDSTAFKWVWDGPQSDEATP